MPDVNVNFNIPEAHVEAFQAAVEELAKGNEKLMLIAVSGNNQNRAEINLVERGDGEGALAFGKRTLRKVMMGAVQIGGLKLDRARYEAEVAAIDAPDPNVPDETISN